MIIADTSIWIEFLKGRNSDVFDMLSLYLKRREVVGISAVFGELLLGVKNNREAKIIQDFWDNLPKVNEHGLFINAGKLACKHKLYTKGVGLIDAYILSAALSNDFSLWTLDKKLNKVADEISF
ncbi:MAG: PIN domain-containing protein [Cyclobacteriaceae bacterium]|nr:PIN domain-containing protein [Cyclobacteriaceae bacterium]